MKGRLVFAWLVLLLVAVVLPLPAQQPARQDINAPWRSPNVEPLVERLESESREIYHERRRLAELVSPRPGSVVADVGAGSGFMVELFSEQVGPRGKVYAVDINPKLLDLISQRARKDGRSNIETLLATDDDTRLPANSVDLAFVCDTYHHFEHPERNLRSLYRALRPGGEIVVVDFRRAENETDSFLREHIRATPEVFTREILAAGFELAARHDAPFLSQNFVHRFRKPAASVAGSKP